MGNNRLSYITISRDVCQVFSWGDEDGQRPVAELGRRCREAEAE